MAIVSDKSPSVQKVKIHKIIIIMHMNVYHDSSDLVQWPLSDLNTSGGKKVILSENIQKFKGVFSVHDMVNQCTFLYKNK